MITIRCTESEKRKLCSHDYPIMCAMMDALGHCEADCGKCRRHRKDYINWEIISKPKKQKSSNEDTRTCCNCWANECGMCIETRSPFYKMPIWEIRKTQPRCDVYGSYEGDG